MTVLITGGNGFVGMNIAENLLSRGKDIVMISNSPLSMKMKKFLSSYPGAFESLVVDILDEKKLTDIVESKNISYVIHGAAITSDNEREKRESIQIMNVNVMGTVKLLDIVSRYNIKKFLYLSSASVYGDSSNDGNLIEEETVPEPNSIYSISKYTGERITLRYNVISEVPTVVVRLGSIFGPWEYDTGVRDTLSAPFLLANLARNGQQALLPREGIRDWLYSKDAASAIVELLFNDNLKHNLYNLAYPNTWSMIDWCYRLKEIYHDFQFKIVEENQANISFYSDKDRPPLSVNRIQKDLEFKPRFGPDESFRDYLKWLWDFCNC